MRLFLVLCLFWHCSIAACAQSEDSLFISKISKEVLVSGKVYSNLRVLCKTVGGRMCGSPQIYRAEAWGMDALKAAGADKVYLQPCTVRHWVRGGRDEAWYTYTGADGKTVKVMLDVLALGNSYGTGSRGIQAGLVYCNNFDDLERQKDSIRGKIVFFNYPFNETYLKPFQAYGEAGIYRHSGPSRAARYGALAVVIRSLSGSTDNNPHTGATVYDSGYAAIPAAAMGLRDADKLAALMKEGKKITLHYHSAARFLADTIGHNVIGEITGTTYPKDILTIGGHLDSWDPAEGAHDDGTGCAHSIEVLRTLKVLGYVPRHTLRVVLFVDEENGGRGANAYAAASRNNGETHLFALESDTGGFTPRGFSISASPEQLKKWQAWVPLLLPYGVYELVSGGGGADVNVLHEQFHTVVAELVPDNNRYFDLHHARNDVFENVNKRELELGAINMAALVYLVDKYGI